MALAVGKYLGRLAGYRSGRPVYLINCPDGSPTGKHLGRLVGYRSGRPVYAFQDCMTDNGSYLTGKALGRLVGYRSGRPVYAYQRPCCASGSGSSSSSSYQRTCNCSLDGVVASLPDTLTATFSGGCANLDGQMVTMVLDTEQSVGGVCVWCGDLRITDSGAFICPAEGFSEQKLWATFSCGTTCGDYSLTVGYAYPSADDYESANHCHAITGKSVFAEAGCSIEPLSMTFDFLFAEVGNLCGTCFDDFHVIVTE